MSIVQQPEAYTGIENLEVMQDAVNYNRFLLHTVQKHAPPSARIVDFGAGGGQFAAPMAAAGFAVTALEPDDILRRRLGDSGLRTAAGVHELTNDSVDYVYSLNVLEHIEDDVDVLRQLRPKLTARGALLVYVPAFPVLYTSMDAKVGHVRRYTRSTLVANVTAAGYAVRSVAYVDSVGFLATLAFKLGDKGDGRINPRALRYYDRLVFPLSRMLDTFVHRWFGKNLLLIASKDSSGQALGQ